MKHRRAALVPDIAAIRRSYAITSGDTTRARERVESVERMAAQAKKLVDRAAKRPKKPRRPVITPEIVSATPSGFYASPEWRELRYQALKHYGARSPRTHPGTVIHVDHIKPRAIHPRLALTFSNLQILCEACNLGKSYQDSTDWRRPPAIPQPAIEAAREARRTLPADTPFETVATAMFLAMLDALRRQ